MKQPLVSVIVTTYNNQATLEECLNSIMEQTYPDLELIIVDNYSTDETLDIARRFTRKVYTKGPERCAQRNFAVQHAHGKYVMIVDSDMELTPQVVEQSVDRMQSDENIKGVIIPEESFGEGFWAQCKRLERSFYVGVDWIEAARFFERRTFNAIGGYNEALVSGEDWDLSQRVGMLGSIAHIEALILHNEGRLKLLRTLKKKFYYAGQFQTYTSTRAKQSATHGSQPTNIVLRRFGLYFAQPVKLFKKPHHGIGMLFMKISEFGFGALGYVVASRKRRRAEAA